MTGRADVHVHTKYSGVHRLGPLRFPESVSDPGDVVRKAMSEKLDVLCVTDHNSVQGALKAVQEAKGLDIDVVVGEEVSTADGEVIGLFLTEEVPMDLPIGETIDIIRSQGGLTIAPHPFSVHCPCLKDRIAELDLDGIETLNGGHRDDFANAKAQDVGKSGRWACVGGSDSHYLKTVGSVWTNFDGTTADEFRRSVLSKTTSHGGNVIPMTHAIAWSMGVVAHSDLLIVRSLLGLDKDKLDDPLVAKVHAMKLGQKLGGLAGSFVYLLPPVPFLAGIATNHMLDKWTCQMEESGMLDKLDPII